MYLFELLQKEDYKSKTGLKEYIFQSLYIMTFKIL